MGPSWEWHGVPRGCHMGKCANVDKGYQQNIWTTINSRTISQVKENVILLESSRRFEHIGGITL